MSELNKEVETVTDEEIVESGVHHFSSAHDWVKPADPLLQERLEWFQDQKLAIMMHWGPYSQIGIVESWALSDEDADWSRHDVHWTEDMDQFKREYFALNKTFNPIRFEPEVWADLAAENGFKYFIFTTKHHDGFCMWDTATTDYKITSEETPFHQHKYADITSHLFEAFREKGLAIAAYFSKADWHTPYYWAPNTERGNHMWRGPSYDPKENPELWEKFVNFTHEQMMELLTKYGRIDMLWLDAGWVRDGGRVPQDIRLGELVERARKEQPWLLSVDRTVGGPYENYVTPEQTIPDHAMDIPWESCITIGRSFAFHYDEDFKSLRELVHILVEVVAKGGNLALNIAPQPDGRLPRKAVERVKEFGSWMNTYGEAIYGTRICAPYFTNRYAFTKKGTTVYGFYLYEENEAVSSELLLPYTGEVTSVELLDGADTIQWERTPEGIKVKLSAQTGNETPVAHIFRMQTV